MRNLQKNRYVRKKDIPQGSCVEVVITKQFLKKVRKFGIQVCTEVS